MNGYLCLSSSEAEQQSSASIQSEIQVSRASLSYTRSNQSSGPAESKKHNKDNGDKWFKGKAIKADKQSSNKALPRHELFRSFLSEQIKINAIHGVLAQNLIEDKAQQEEDEADDEEIYGTESESKKSSTSQEDTQKDDDDEEELIEASPLKLTEPVAGSDRRLIEAE